MAAALPDWAGTDLVSVENNQSLYADKAIDMAGSRLADCRPSIETD